MMRRSFYRRLRPCRWSFGRSGAEGGISEQKERSKRSGGELFQDVINGDPKTPDTGPAAPLSGFDLDTLVVVHALHPSTLAADTDSTPQDRVSVETGTWLCLAAACFGGLQLRRV